MRLLVRRLVLAALVCLVLLLSLGVALGLALQAVQRDPQALTQRLRALLPEGSGVSISLGTVGVRLLPTPDRKEGGAWAAGAVMGTAAVPERGSVVAAGIPHRNNRRLLIPQRRKMIHAVLPGAAGYDGETKAFHL